MARILVVDDEESIRHLLRFTLELAGHEVILAEDGLRGMGAAKRQLPAAIVLDIMMPFMDGGMLLDALKADERTHDIPVLILTAATVRSLHERMLRAGAAAIMTKPFDPADVVSAVTGIIEQAVAPPA